MCRPGARHLQEPRRVGWARLSVPVGRGADVVPQTADLAGPARRQTLDVGDRDDLPRGLRSNEVVADAHLDSVAREGAEASSVRVPVAQPLRRLSFARRPRLDRRRVRVDVVAGTSDARRVSTPALLTPVARSIHGRPIQESSSDAAMSRMPDARSRTTPGASRTRVRHGPHTRREPRARHRVHRLRTLSRRKFSSRYRPSAAGSLVARPLPVSSLQKFVCITDRSARHTE
jgi:hypothetical protein